MQKETPARRVEELLEYYDEQQIMEALKDEIRHLSEKYGAGYLADRAAVEETTIHSWQAPSGKLPGLARFIFLVARLSEHKDNSLIANLMLHFVFRIQRVDAFRTREVNHEIKDELFSLFLLVTRLTDAYVNRDPDAGLMLMEHYDEIGRDMRAEFEAQKAAHR